MGRITFEVVSTFFVFTKASKVTKVGDLAKADFLEELAKGEVFKKGRGPNVLTKITQYIAKLRATKMCFIAGTLVWCQVDGLAMQVPIEQLERHKMVDHELKVWAKDEITGEEAWRSPVAFFVTHPEELHHVSIDKNGDGKADETLSGTAPHPFWVMEQEEFVPMGELKPGDALYLAHGDSATVLENSRERAPPGQTFKTYNFEVADFHTYFVGNSGVWVHNRGRDCDRLFSLFQRFLNKADNNPWQAHGLAMQRFDGILGADPRLAQNGVARVQMFTEARRRHFSDLGGHTPLWRQGGQNLTLTRPPADNSQMANQLRGNMRSVFKCDPKGQGFAAHHIVPHSMPGPDWDRARQVLANVDVHLNEAANGIFVPHIPSTAAAYPSLGKKHDRSFHANAMAKKVADRLEAAASGGKTAVQDELQRIANDIADGILP